jgi:EAL domain-containing protein (putative c-di-GMP-specific phosphodiesterase class I)
MKHADIALHYAKEQGKNNFQFYSIEMSRKEELKLKSQNILASALMGNKFYLQYQPRFHAMNQQLISIETFLCLKESDHTTLTFQEMLSLTKDMGLSIVIMDWMVRHACQQLKIWQHTIYQDINLTIHCDMAHIKQSCWVEKVLKIIEELNISPKSLTLEISEPISTQLDEQYDDNIFNILAVLKNFGVSLILRNFGMNCLSLNLSSNFYFDKIKIHPKWIQQLLLDKTFAEMMMAIIFKAKKYGIPIIAGNIDNAEQMKFLKNIGCNELQGNFIIPPMLQDKMTEYLHDINQSNQFNQSNQSIDVLI